MAASLQPDRYNPGPSLYLHSTRPPACPRTEPATRSPQACNACHPTRVQLSHALLVCQVPLDEPRHARAAELEGFVRAQLAAVHAAHA